MKNFSLQISDEAKEDLLEIWLNGAVKWSEKQADTHLYGIKKRIYLLTEFPHLGRKREDLSKTIYSFSVPPHIILYTIDDNCINIRRVLDGRADLPQAVRN